MNRRVFVDRMFRFSLAYGFTSELLMRASEAWAEDGPPPPQLPSPNYEIKAEELIDKESQSIGDNYIITAVNVELTTDNVPSGNNLIVYADSIRLKGAINLPGKTVFLLARSIIADTASINVNGSDGVSALTNRAADGRILGQSGSDGEDGRDGSKGGTVIINAFQIAGNLVINASGGKGGNGQAGGNGLIGGKGSHGADNRDIDGGPGGKGLKGGDAGKGGAGGKGGDSGIIKIYLVKSLGNNSTIKITRNGGLGGQPGDPGIPGDGGPGGDGGTSKPSREYFRDGGGRGT